MGEPVALIRGKDILCPICLRKAAELTGNETVKNFRFMCRGRNRNDKHYFIINVGREEK